MADPGHQPRSGAARWARDVLRAAGFLTRLPVGRWMPPGPEEEPEGDDGDDTEYAYVDVYGPERPEEPAPGEAAETLAGAARAFPLVGLALGIVAAAALGLAHAAGLPPLVAAAIAVAVLIASINVVGGFLVTRRMLAMFQKS